MSVPCELLLHPELLSNQQLMSVLLERHLRVPNIEHMHRDELLELFHQYCVPYGQRRYRDSGRGKLLNKNRNLIDSPPEWMKFASTSNQNSGMSQKHLNERIKPPPDLLAGLAKRFKISCDTEAKTITQEQNSKRKTITTPDAEPSQKKVRKHNLITWP